MNKTNEWKAIGISVCLLLGGIALAQEVAEINWSQFPATVQGARQAFDEAVKTAQEQYDDAVAEAREPLAKAITDAQEEATRSGDLDVAVALRDAMQRIEAGDVSPDRAAVRELMVGRWKFVDAGTNWYLVFAEDGSVASYTAGGAAGDQGGRWKATSAGVVIKWSDDIRQDIRPGARFWHVLRYPIDPRMTTGDSWAGLDQVKAVKMGR